MNTKQYVKLYKVINGEMILVDFGLKKFVDLYVKQGFIVEY